MDKKTLKEKGRSYLRDNLKPGTTLYNVSYHDRTHRKVKFFIIDDDRRPINQTYNIACGFEEKRNDEGFIMTKDIDMLIYHVGHMLWPEGFDCPGTHCRHPEHTNERKPYAGQHHTDGGYALNSYDM